MERNHTIFKLSLRQAVRWMILASVCLLQSCYYYAYDSDPYQDDVYYGRAAPEYHAGVDVAYGPYDNPYSQWAYLGFYGPFGYLGYFDHYHYVSAYRHFAYTPYYAYYYRGYPGFSHYYPYYRGGFNRPGVVYGRHPRHHRGDHGYRPPHRDDSPYQRPRPGGVRHANRVREDDQLALPREGRAKGERASGAGGSVPGTTLPLRRTQYGSNAGRGDRLPGQSRSVSGQNDLRTRGERRNGGARNRGSNLSGRPSAGALPGANGQGADFNRSGQQQGLPAPSLDRPQIGLRVSPGALGSGSSNQPGARGLPGVTPIPSTNPVPSQLNGSPGALPNGQQSAPRSQEPRRSGRNRDSKRDADRGGRNRDHRASPRSSGRTQGNRRTRDGGGRQRQQRQ